MNALTAPTAPPSRDSVISAIRHAAAETGVDFAYLKANAAVESSLDPHARARSSSATGLYQFIESTWLSMVDRHGAKHGLDNYAALIDRDGQGRPVAVDEAARQEILDLRKDPKLAALMAGELAAENKAYLQRHTGREPSQTDLYLAHFLGPRGAADFLNAMSNNAERPAAPDFPAAARSNPSIFYDGNGRATSLAEIYDHFGGKLARAGGLAGPAGTGTGSEQPMDAAPRVIPQAPHVLPPVSTAGLSGPSMPFEMLLVLQTLDPSTAFDRRGSVL